jgi:hypothetical protein
MFFLKRQKPHDEMPEPEQLLSVRERAIKVFSKIEGLDDIKEMMLRALESSERAHTLLAATDGEIYSIQSVLCGRSIYHQSRATEIHS